MAKRSKSNCGIGPGGFQKGNTCAKGGGGGLSDEQKEAIKFYTEQGGNFELVNSVIRTGNGFGNVEAETHGKVIKELLESGPSYSGTVYRGMGFYNKRDFDSFLGKIQDKGYSPSGIASTSKSREVAERYANPKHRGGMNEQVIFKMKMKSGIDISSVGEGSVATSGQEVWARPGSNWKVGSVKTTILKKGGRFSDPIRLHEIELKEIDQITDNVNLTINSVGAYTEKKLNGRDYLVVPMTMIVPGVLPGSNGSIMYPRTKINERVSRWNHMPIVVNHPVDINGEYTSARSPDVYNAIGLVFNAKGGSKLTAEAWIDVERANEVDPRIVEHVKSNNPVEISTGLHTSARRVKGTYKGMTYNYLLTGFEPDHLAILLDEKGACSIDDGCGLGVNKLSHSNIREALTSLIKEENPSEPGNYKDCWVRDVFDKEFIYSVDSKTYKRSYTKKGDSITVGDNSEEVISTTVYKPAPITGNEGSCEMGGECDENCPCKKKKRKRKMQVNAKKGGGANCGIGPGGFQPGNKCAKGGGGGGKKGSETGSLSGLKPRMIKLLDSGKLRGRSYSEVKKAMQSLGPNMSLSKRKKVNKLIEDLESRHGISNNKRFDNSNSEDGMEVSYTPEQREELIDILVGNTEVENYDPLFSEDDQEWLEGLTDNQLYRLNDIEAFTSNSDDVDDDGEDEVTTTANGGKMKKGKKDLTACSDKELEEEMNMRKKKKMENNKKPTGNSMSAQEWLETAPDEIRNVVVNAIQRERSQKEQLVAKITSNKNNVLTEDQLNTMSINQLTGIAALCEEKKEEQQPSGDVSQMFPNYIGQAGAPRMTGNKKISPLESVDIDFSDIKLD